jgi:hypothetical protein
VVHSEIYEVLLYTKGISVRPLGGGSQSGGEMRRCVLCGCWARLAFPRAREKKSSSSHIGKIDEACESNSCPPAPDRGLLGAGNEHS